MRFAWMTMLLLVPVGSCGWWTDNQKYSVYFQPYSADPDSQARETIHAAADYARNHPVLPVAIDGFAAPPGPKLDVDGLSAQRAAVVKQILVAEGVSPTRIATTASGITDPKGLPSVAVRRVDISVGR